ncbi:MAG: hypothetical protein AB1486_13895 [Planctomycetota bacterium]
MTSGSERNRYGQRLWFWGILLLFLVVILFTYRDYGITWDEDVQSRYGELVHDYFASGFAKKECNSFLNLGLYGPAFELAAAAVYAAHYESRFEIRHLLIALTALLAVAAVMRYGGLLGDPLVPLFASLALLTFPRFYGDAFNNSKDMPFACGFTWAMFAIVLLFHGKRCSWWKVLLAGFLIGLALSIRTGGFLLFLFLAAVALYSTFLQKPQQGRRLPQLLGPARIAKFLVIIVLSWAIMVALWPWAHQSIVLNPLRSFESTTAFQAPYPLLFNGKIVLSNQLPWYYLPQFLVITTPPILLLLFFVGLGSSIHRQVRSPGDESNLPACGAQFWFFFPLLYFIVKRPNVYDGIRHFLFIVPALALIAGIGATAVARTFTGSRGKVATGVLVVLILLTVPSLVALHPYQTTYFNFLVGGLKEAAKSYETDYWTSSYKEAMEWVNERSAERGGPVSVLLAANDFNPQCAEYYRAPQVKVERMFTRQRKGGLPSGFDYYIGTTRYGYHLNFPEAPVVHVVGRAGAAFTVIRGRSKKP